MNLCGSYVLYLCETQTKNLIRPFITLYVIQPGIYAAYPAVDTLYADDRLCSLVRGGGMAQNSQQTEKEERKELI